MKSKESVLEMQRLEDGSVRLLDCMGEVVAEFQSEPTSDILQPTNQKRAIAWAVENGYRVDHTSHWSMIAWRQKIDRMWIDLCAR